MSKNGRSGLRRNTSLAAVLTAIAGASPSQAASNIDTAQPSYLSSGLGTSVNPVFQGGTLIIDSNTAPYPQNFTLNGSTTNTINSNGNSAVFTGGFSDAIAGVPGNLTITNSGVFSYITFEGPSTYTGNTTVANGVDLAEYNSVSSASSLIIDGRLDIYTEAVRSLSGGGTVDLYYYDSNGVSLSLNNANGIFSGSIIGIGGIAVSGMETLSGINTYEGTTLINSGGKLTLTGSGSIASSPSVLDNGTLDISGTTAGATINELRAGQAGSALVLGNQTLTANNASFIGAVTGTGNLVLNGGSFELNQSSVFSGSATVNEAVLTVDNTTALGTPSSSLTFSQSTLSVRTDLSIAGEVSLAGSDIIDTDGHTVALAGTLSGSGTLSVTGGGNVILSAPSSYSGHVDIDSTISSLNPPGITTTLKLSGDGNLAGATLELLQGYYSDLPRTPYADTKSVFDISATTAGASVASISGGIGSTVLLGSQTLTISNGSGYFSGSIEGTGGLTLAGGTETLAGLNTYSGVTNIGPGATLVFGSSGILTASSSMTLNGTLDLTGTYSQTTISTLSGSGTVKLGGGLELINASGTFSGAIIQPIVSGGTPFFLGTLVVDLNGTYAPTVSQGLPSGSFFVAGGTETLTGPLQIYSATTGVGAKIIVNNGSGIIAPYGLSNNGTFDISTANSGTSIGTLFGMGQINMGAQTLTITKAGYENRVNIPVLNYQAQPPFPYDPDAICGCFSFGSSGNLVAITYDTYSGTINGTGGVAVTGGMERFTGVNTYGGGTAVNGAVLGVNSDAALGAASGGLALTGGTLVAFGTINSDRILTLTGADTIDPNQFTVSLAGPIGGNGSLAVMGGGTLTLTGANSYAGGTSVNGTNLAINADAALGALSGGLSLTDATLEALANFSSPRALMLSGADTIATGGNSLVWSGSVTGAGSLTVGGGGQLTLASNALYSGLTTINPGTVLALAGAGSIAASVDLVDNGTFDISATSGASVTSLSGGGAVALGGTTLALTNATDNFSGTITGSGGLLITGGSETLTGISTYSGGTTLSSASLAINANAALGVSSGGLTLADGTLTALGDLALARVVTLSGADTINTSGHAVTQSGVVGGSGSLIASGGGELSLTGSNGYTGGTRITGGTILAVASDAALGAVSGELVFDTGTLLALGSFSSARAIATTAGGGTIDTNGFAINLNGPITLDGALNRVGAGELSFGSATTMTGILTVSNGTFATNASFYAPSVVVSSSGTLRGTGIINAPTTVSGTLAPGNSPGTLTFTAPVTLTAGSTTEFDIDGTGTGTGAGNYGRVIVSGAGNTITLGGTLLPLLRGITGSATNSYSPSIGQRFQVITAQGGVAGSYSGLAQPVGLASGSRFDALYGPNTLSLVVTPAAYGNLSTLGMAETANQISVGRVLDANRPVAGIRPDSASAALFDPLYSLASPAIPVAMDQLGPSIYGDGLIAAREGWGQVATAVSDQLDARQDGPSSTGFAPGPHGLTLWASAIGQFTRAGDRNAPSYHASLGGAVAGIDKQAAENAVLGVAVGGGSVQTSAANGATAAGNMVQFAVYGSLQTGRFFLDAQAGYLHLDEDVRRSLSFWSTSAFGDTAADGGGAQIRAGLRQNYGNWLVEPALTLTAVSLASSAMTESTGGVLAESIAAQSTTSIQSLASLRASTQFEVAGGVPIQVHALFGWTHEFANVTASTTASLALNGANLFVAASAPESRDAARFGAGIDVALSATTSLYGTYAATMGGNSTVQSLNAGLSIRW